jgi:hypothetical protein
MNIIKQKIGLLTAMMVILLSCEKDVILDLSDIEGRYLIVEANIDDSRVRQMIRLYRSSSFYDSEKGLPVSNAIISISDGNSDYYFSEAESEKNQGNYYNLELSTEMVIGKEYHLTVRDEGKVYTATSTLKPVPDVDSVSLRINMLSRIGIINEVLVDIFIHFENLPYRGNYYLINVYINDNIQTFTPSQKTVFSDENMEGYASLYVRSFRNSDLNPGDKVSLELRSISKEQYNFYTDFFMQTELSGNPFAGAPPANIPTNLSEGARGFFQVSTVSTTSKIF